MMAQVARDCIRAPTALDDVLPRLTSEQDKATMRDPKTPRARNGASKKHKLMVNDEHSKSPLAHSQQEKGGASIDATEDVAHSPDVSNPRDDQLTEVLSDEYDSEDAIIRTRDKEEKFGPSRMFGLTNV
ncbi:hypothetical protein Tco_0249410, partial [Tanacetum coccineum]